MTTRLLAALLGALLLLVLPTAASADTTTVVAADSTESEDLEYGDDGHGGDEEHGDEDGHGGGHELKLDNGDPQDAGAQALAGESGSSLVDVMMWVMLGLVVLLMVGGLAIGRGKNA